MYEDDLKTGTDYQYNSNLVSTLLEVNKMYNDLSNEDLLRLKKEHEDLFNSLPKKDLPIDEQSDLEKAIREDYQEISEVLKKRDLI